MTEDEAQAWLVDVLNVSRETLDRLDAYFHLVRKGQEQQNLVSTGTLSAFWARHIVDSAQLVLLAGKGVWLDIGSGAGVPGIVTAILTGASTILVEPRLRRASFLQETVEILCLSNVRVVASPVQRLAAAPVDVITARAVAALPALIEMALPFAHDETVWLLPKGKTAQSELASLASTWQGHWELQPSVTDPESRILVGCHVRMNDQHDLRRRCKPERRRGQDHDGH